MALRNFSPNALLGDWTDEKYCPNHNGKSFEESIRAAFNLPKSDNYVYRAQGETTLAITQRAIAGKRVHGMHDWYHDEDKNPVCNINCPIASRASPSISSFHRDLAKGLENIL